MTESEALKQETPLLAGVPNNYVDNQPAIKVWRPTANNPLECYAEIVHTKIQNPTNPSEYATTEESPTTSDYNIGKLPQDLADQYVCIRPEHPGLTKSSFEPVIWGKIQARSVVVCGAATIIALAGFSQAISLSIYVSYTWLTVRDQIAVLVWVDIAFGFVIMAAHSLCLFAIQQSRKPLLIFGIAVAVVATLVRLICQCYLIDIVRWFPPNPLKTVHMFATTFHLVFMLCLSFLFFGACADYLDYPVAKNTLELIAEILTDIYSALQNCWRNIWMRKKAKKVKRKRKRNRNG